MVNELSLLNLALIEVSCVCPFEMKKRWLSCYILDPTPREQDPSNMLIFRIPNKYFSILRISTFSIVLLNRNNLLRVIVTTPTHCWSHFLFNFFDIVSFVFFQNELHIWMRCYWQFLFGLGIYFDFYITELLLFGFWWCLRIPIINQCPITCPSIYFTKF